MSLFWTSAMLIGAILVAGIVYFLFFSEFSVIDRCLDHGGMWDYNMRVCKF